MSGTKHLSRSRFAIAATVGAVFLTALLPAAWALEGRSAPASTITADRGGAAAPAPARASGPSAQPAPGAGAAGGSSTAAPRTAAPSGPISVRVFTIKFRNPSDVAQLVTPLLSERGSITTGPPRLRTLTVQDRPEVLGRIADLITSYDLPPRNVQFTVTLIMATRNEEAGQSISREVRGISEALPDITRWTNYKTLDSVTISGSEGSRTTRDLADAYRITFDLESVSDARGIIRLNPFSLEKVDKGVTGAPVFTSVYTTTVNLTNDKLLTIGAAKSETSPRALFLAIRARIEKP